MHGSTSSPTNGSTSSPTNGSTSSPTNGSTSSPTKGKIHFASLFGVHYDIDLFPWWTKYYLDMKLDSYTVFLHQASGGIDPLTVDKFKNAGFTVYTVEGPHGDGMIRKLCLRNFAETLPGEDMIVTADADEFQCVPVVRQAHQELVEPLVGELVEPLVGELVEPLVGELVEPPDYRALEKEFDIIGGFMVDRYSMAMEKCVRDPFQQYPYQEPWSRSILANFTPPWLRASNWPDTRRTKIFASRCGYDVSYMGSHSVDNVYNNARIADNYRCIHFAWREGAKYKAAYKSYYSLDNLKEMFNGKIPPLEEETLTSLRNVNTFVAGDAIALMRNLYNGSTSSPTSGSTLSTSSGTASSPTNGSTSSPTRGAVVMEEVAACAI